MTQKEINIKNKYKKEIPVQIDRWKRLEDEVHKIIWMAVLKDTDKTAQEVAHFETQKIMTLFREVIKAAEEVPASEHQFNECGCYSNCTGCMKSFQKK